MERLFRIPPPPRLPAAANHALAVVAPLAALALQHGLRAWAENIPFVPFFLVVSLIASIGGWGPGALCVAVSTAGGYALLATSVVPEHRAAAALGAICFFPVAVITAGFGAVIRAGFRERETAARELAEAVRMRDQFISTASHELKTPLTSLSLAAQQIARAQARGGVAVESRIDTLLRQTRRLSRLVDRLLDVARLSSGRPDLSLETLDLSAVLRDIGDAFHEEAVTAGASLTIEAPEPIVGHWDRMRVEQIVTNLLSNALKYAGQAPVVASAQQQGSSALLVVRDGGVGIPPQDQERVFERFERGQHGSRISGFGLGLWVVRQNAAVLGGSVRLESAPRQGATFTVSLPLEGPPPGPAKP